ncbi:ferredoxin [Mycobacterium branderi]|uniref:ferredoxin n=1 Tax=Mycobacterium branderi TaxID=43348 RepID=UPI00360B16F6
MRVIAHHDRCVGTGICESILESVFEVGDEGVVVVHNENIADGDEPALRRAVASCPTETLELAEDQ